ncbi:Ethyl tert-butyl ether degradation EthD [Lasiodiplodia theobromae]|uniref:Ethyl tert-butyl ether degradation EthD n=1 Tax=Lasiodiplodia theobromae TaxID=45133 RepID=UPI0015C39EA5|nr:Ethyl tert-butyl ether degradation EthD [Lasiodiplodia theobromae]KAF4544512.1 Ethyl tert-butyl ether degradation EthD [Lasiodiplodia theobromae]
MTAKYLILFPRGSIFNKEHYLKVHMPLIAKHYPDDFLSWEAVELAADAAYEIATRVEWTTAEAFESLHHSEAGKEIFADIPNFASAPAIFIKEEKVLGSGP